MTIDEIKKIVEQICLDSESGLFVPILEMDVNGYLYHLFIANKLCELNKIHPCTRIIGSNNTSEKYDLVVGNVELREDGRPAVLPEIIIEIKIFPKGFTNRQLQIRFEHIFNDDLRKLGAIESKIPIKVQFVYDAVGYLDGLYKNENRENYLAKIRDEISKDIYLLFARNKNGKWQVYSK
ncbi:MAG: hypothetical protein M1371_04130 [Actinobacteria bacterium]|nr:hypothetical protein [Actinomycetota bacterium]